MAKTTVASPGVYRIETLQAIGIKLAADLHGMPLYMPPIEQNGNFLTGGQQCLTSFGIDVSRATKVLPPIALTIILLSYYWQPVVPVKLWRATIVVSRVK